MSNFTLPQAALTRITAQVNCSGTFNHAVTSPWGGHQVALKLHVERSKTTTECIVEMGGERHSITVENNDPERHIQVADFIDAIANGRVDSAAPAPARVTRLAILPEPEQLLNATQEAGLQLLVRRGGALDLDVGLEQPVRVSVHRLYPRQQRDLPGITALLCIGEAQPRTVCWTTRDSNAALLARLVASIEQLTIRATPKAAA